MKIRKGDKVKIIRGKDRGKSGKVMQVFPAENKVIVEGFNLLTKNLKPRKENEKGERIKYNAPMSTSNVMMICGKCNKPTRIGYRVLEDGRKKERYCHQCQQTL